VLESVFSDTGVEVSFAGGVGDTTVVVSATGAVSVSDGVFTTGVEVSEEEGEAEASGVGEGLGVGSTTTVGDSTGATPL
jgi:hypothetical protein